jgi:hypothetical protein
MERPPFDDLDVTIRAILDKSLFKLARSIAETVRVGLATILQRLHDSIGFGSFHLHWVSHVLTVGLHDKQVKHTQAMLPFLHPAERDGWHHPVTSDEL